MFIGVSFSFFRLPPFVGAYLFHSGFFSKRRDDSANNLVFWANKTPPEVNQTGKTGSEEKSNIRYIICKLA